MAIYTLAVFSAPPDAEPAMHELAARIRRDLPGATWTVYRDRAKPDRYVALSRDDDRAAGEARARAVDAALGARIQRVDDIECELVTSSDLAPRPRRR
jgi:hypothetical protein